MDSIQLFLPWLPAMAALLCCSAFFSGSEASLFYLRRQDRRAFRSGNPAQRMAARLLDDPERLLSAVLFWNLAINMTYFAIASIVSLRLEAEGFGTAAGFVAVGSLLAIILFGEMAPKSIAVLRTRTVATLVGVPLSVAVRTLDPLMPMLQLMNRATRRLLWPDFQSQPSLELNDLERAIQVSTSDGELIAQEQKVLENIISLSDIRADELMRPRTQCQSFPPPVSLSDLRGELPPSGYVLVTEPQGEEFAAAIPLKYLSDASDESLGHHGESVVYVPWSTTAAAVLEEMRRADRKVAAVVNEFGETIGVITFDDILTTIFTADPSRTARLFRRSSVEQLDNDRWRVNGITTLRRLAKQLGVRLPESKNVTVAGLMQELLQGFPQIGDESVWGPFHWLVTEAGPRGHLIVEIQAARGKVSKS